MTRTRRAIASAGAVVVLSACGGVTMQRAGSTGPAPMPSPTPVGSWVPSPPPVTVTPVPGSLCAKHPTDRHCGPTWHPAPPGPGEVVYDGWGFRTVPAPPDAHPRISRAEAIARAEREPGATDPHGPVDASLVLLTDGYWPPDPADPRHYDHRLTWMVVAHNVGSFCTMCGSHWPGYVATGYVAIDAMTGAVMEDDAIG